MEKVENEPEIVESAEKSRVEEEERVDDTIYIFDSNDAVDKDDGAGCLTVLLCMIGLPAFLYICVAWT